VTDVAIQSLNGMELGDRYLVVQRASVGAKPGSSITGMIPNPNLPYDQFPEIPRPIMPAGEGPSQDARILLMLNMVTTDDLIEDGEYGDLYEDVKEECSKYGPVEDLRIPRPIKKDKNKWGSGESGIVMDPQAAARADEAAGVGRVYVKYVSSEGANQALKALAGRSIVATLLSEDSQTTPPLNLIFAPQPEAPPPLPME
jgi:splicing factor U2AF 65 kDa subunit